MALANSSVMPHDEKKTDQMFIVEASFVALSKALPRIGHGNEAVKSSPPKLKHQPQLAYLEQNPSPLHKNLLNSPDTSQHETAPDTEPAHTTPASAITSMVQHFAPTVSSGKPVIGEREGDRQSKVTREKSGAIGDMLFGEEGAPHFIHREAPLYPFLARRKGKEGKVVLRLTLDCSGALKQVEVVEEGGYGFTEAAIRAASRSTFSPARRNGTLVASRVLLPVRFVLRGEIPD